MAKVWNVRTGEALEKIIHERSEGRLVVVDFFATWCGPCKMISPKMDTLAQQLPNVIFLKVDVDALSSVAGKYGIKAMPTFLFFKNGSKLHTIQGADINGIQQSIKNFM